MKYHYSYFIYPYVIQENKYNNYIQRLLSNDKFKIKFFEREKDLDVYNYFLPTIRDYLFPSFKYANKKIKGTNSLDQKLIENMIKSWPCAMFDYDIGNDAQAKTGAEDGIFFKIQKMEVICFKTGICFLVIKTNVENTDEFSDLLNFNLKFRTVNSEIEGSEAYNNIKIQTSTFSDIRRLSDIIRSITGRISDSQKIDIDVNRFLIYSYVCIDQEYWNENRPFSEIEKEFFKFANILNSEFNSSYNNDRLQIVNLGKYTKVGISKVGASFLASSVNMVNYTKLIYNFENQYFYTYIFSLYQKFYFAKLLNDLSEKKSHKKAKIEFANFTKQIWIHEVTNDDNGVFILEKAKKALGLKKLYYKVKEQYDVMYKNFTMQDNSDLNKIVIILLVASIITNIINFIRVYKLK